MTGDDLIRELAEMHLSKDYLVWERMPLGSVTMHAVGIADLVTMTKQYSALITIYEVKVSRSDFLRDMALGKWRKYLDHCHRLLFAAPAGIISPFDLPPEAGLTVRGDKGWRVLKSPPRRPMTPSAELLLALLFRGYTDFCAGRDLKDRERWERNYNLQDLAHEFGVKVAKKIADAERLVEQAHGLLEQISQILEYDYARLDEFSSAYYALQERVDKLLKQYKLAPVMIKLYRLMDTISTYGGFDGWTADKMREIGDELHAMAQEKEASLEQGGS